MSIHSSVVNAIGIIRAERINLQRPISRLNSCIRLRVQDFELRAYRAETSIDIIIGNWIFNHSHTVCVNACTHCRSDPTIIDFVGNYEGLAMHLAKVNNDVIKKSSSGTESKNMNSHCQLVSQMSMVHHDYVVGV